jgi:hypothetical protein
LGAALLDFLMAAARSADFTPDQAKLGVERLRKVLGDLRRFDPANVTDQHNMPAIPRLSAAIDEALVRTFGADTLDYQRYRRATDLARRLINGPTMPIADVRRELARVKARSVGLLEQAIEGLRARAAEPVSKATTSTPKDRTELLTLKPGIWGLSFDLKEAWRRVRLWWQTRK